MGAVEERALGAIREDCAEAGLAPTPATIELDAEALNGVTCVFRRVELEE